MKDKKVFMGGTCNESTWREDFVKKFEAKRNECKVYNFKFFNPVVEDWDEEAQRKEDYEKRTSDYWIFCITPKMTGVYSIAEVMIKLFNVPRRTIFCVLDEDGGKKFPEFMKRSMNKIVSDIQKMGYAVYRSLDEMVNSFINIDKLEVQKENEPFNNPMNIYYHINYLEYINRKDNPYGMKHHPISIGACNDDVTKTFYGESVDFEPTKITVSSNRKYFEGLNQYAPKERNALKNKDILGYNEGYIIAPLYRVFESFLTWLNKVTEVHTENGISYRPYQLIGYNCSKDGLFIDELMDIIVKKHPELLDVKDYKNLNHGLEKGKEFYIPGLFDTAIDVKQMLYHRYDRMKMYINDRSLKEICVELNSDNFNKLLAIKNINPESEYVTEFEILNDKMRYNALYEATMNMALYHTLEENELGLEV